MFLSIKYMQGYGDANLKFVILSTTPTFLKTMSFSHGT